jgi:hypothetical protein
MPPALKEFLLLEIAAAANLLLCGVFKRGASAPERSMSISCSALVFPRVEVFKFVASRASSIHSLPSLVCKLLPLGLKNIKRNSKIGILKYLRI